VGRILSFGGSMVLQNGNQVLHEIVSKLPDRRVAIHASMALAHPLQINFKSLEIAGDSMRGAKIRGKEMDIKGAKSLMNKTVLAQMNTASESIGHIDFKHTVDRFSRVVAEHGDVETAVTTQTELLKTFTTQKVKDTILTQVKDTRDQYRAQLKK